MHSLELRRGALPYGDFKTLVQARNVKDAAIDATGPERGQR
jgi:hypothetical protein